MVLDQWLSVCIQSVNLDFIPYRVISCSFHIFLPVASARRQRRDLLGFSQATSRLLPVKRFKKNRGFR